VSPAGSSEGTPAGGVPVGGVPAGGVPAGGVPAGVQAGGVPARGSARGFRAAVSTAGLDIRLAIAAVFVFVGTTIWWVSADDRVQDWDNGLHTVLANNVRAEVQSGHLTAPFTDFNTYPPLGHIVGALGLIVGGLHPGSVILASNIVFVPLLAASCYGIGTLVYGQTRAGLLAALFALGTPMIVSEMHEFLLDPEQAALVAAGVWATLASNRFERTGLAGLAGVLCGLAMLTKQTSVLFFAGVLLVAFARGGWRHWRGLAAFAIGLAVIAGPWYVYHAHELRGLVAEHDATATAYTAPSRFSAESLAYYFWDALNIQLLVPLVVFFVVGTCLAVRDLLRAPRAADLRVELLAGIVVAWVGTTLIVHKDARYSLPELVFVAVLGAGWIAVARPRIRRAATAVLGVVVLVNLVGVSAGVGHPERVTLPGAAANATFQRVLTAYSPDGWLRGGPGTDGRIPSLMSALRRAGIRSVTFDGGSADAIDFNTSGLQVRALEAGLAPTDAYDPANLGPHGAFLLRHFPVAGDPPPCRRMDDGSGVYVVVGNAAQPLETDTFLCPGHTPETYRRTAPLSPDVTAQLESQIPQPYQSRIAAVMSAMHRQGVALVEFDAPSSDVPFFAAGPLAKLAAASGLSLPATYSPATLGPHDAFMFRHADGPGNPPACVGFPDGTGLYVVLGDAVKPFSAYELYCPTRVPRLYPASGG